MWFAGVGVLMVTFSCGDDDGGDAPASSATATCAKGCARAAAARCPNQPSSCQQLCEQQISNTPAGCIAYVNAYADCIGSAVFSCDAQGQAEARTCSAPLAVWAACANGTGVPDASAPDASSSVPDATMAVPDTSVPPVPDAALGDASMPVDAGALVCPAQPGDGQCELCIEAACCPEAIVCNANTDCVGLSDCGAACPNDDDGSCADACNTRYAAGVAPLGELLSCATVACRVACSDDTLPNSRLNTMLSR